MAPFNRRPLVAGEIRVTNAGPRADGSLTRVTNLCADCGTPTHDTRFVRCRHCSNLYKNPLKRRWTDEEMLELLRAEYLTTGEPAAFYDWKRSHPDGPKPHTYVKRFGKWSHALRLAGVPAREPGQVRHATSAADTSRPTLRTRRTVTGGVLGAKLPGETTDLGAGRGAERVG